MKRHSELRVASDFPGGSARVESIDQGARALHVSPFPYEGRGWACWWYLRMEGIDPGETITLRVSPSLREYADPWRNGWSQWSDSWVTPDRCAFSLDGKTWKQTPLGERDAEHIVYRQRIDAQTAWFAWGPPFVLSDANRLLQWASRKTVEAQPFQLCQSADGHSVPALRIVHGSGAEPARRAVWVHAREHAWECGSSWVAQGFVEWLLSSLPEAAHLREQADIVVVPVMDVDNVERGAGGKEQRPHDHGRDWSEHPVWPEVAAALRQLTDLDAQGRLDVLVDLHNPGASDRYPFFHLPWADSPSETWRHCLDGFVNAAEQEMRDLGKAPHKPTGPTYVANWENISINWMAGRFSEHVVAVVLEVPWNTRQSTPTGYRRVGRELGMALERYFGVRAG